MVRNRRLLSALQYALSAPANTNPGMNAIGPPIPDPNPLLPPPIVNPTSFNDAKVPNSLLSTSVANSASVLPSQMISQDNNMPSQNTYNSYPFSPQTGFYPPGLAANTSGKSTHSDGGMAAGTNFVGSDSMNSVSSRAHSIPNRLPTSGIQGSNVYHIMDQNNSPKTSHLESDSANYGESYGNNSGKYSSNFPVPTVPISKSNPQISVPILSNTSQKSNIPNIANHIPTNDGLNNSFKAVTSLSHGVDNTSRTLSFRTCALVSPLIALNFDRIGENSWTMKKMLIYSMEAFLGALLNDFNSTGIYLVNEGKLCSALATSFASAKGETTQTNNLGLDNLSNATYNCHSEYGKVSELREELEAMNCLVASWTNTGEYHQFNEFIIHYTTIVSDSSKLSNDHVTLLQHWLDSSRTGNRMSKLTHPSASNDSGNEDNDERFNKRLRLSSDRSLSEGILVYETISQVGIVIRKNLSYDIGADMWCRLFPNELDQSLINEINNASKHPNHIITFEALLSKFLPQLKAAILQCPRKDMVVQYYPHKYQKSQDHSQMQSLLGTVPILPQASHYRTIGKLTDPAASVISRYFNATCSYISRLIMLFVGWIRKGLSFMTSRYLQSNELL